MLKYFHEWLLWDSSGLGDKSHRCSVLLEEYLETKPANPFSISDFHNSHLDNKIVTEKVREFLDNTWYMVLSGGTYYFANTHDFNTPQDTVILVQPKLTEMELLAYAK